MKQVQTQAVQGAPQRPDKFMQTLGQLGPMAGNALSGAMGIPVPLGSLGAMLAGQGGQAGNVMNAASGLLKGGGEQKNPDGSPSGTDTPGKAIQGGADAMQSSPQQVFLKLQSGQPLTPQDQQFLTGYLMQSQGGFNPFANPFSG